MFSYMYFSHIFFYKILFCMQFSILKNNLCAGFKHLIGFYDRFLHSSSINDFMESQNKLLSNLRNDALFSFSNLQVAVKKFKQTVNKLLWCLQYITNFFSNLYTDIWTRIIMQSHTFPFDAWSIIFEISSSLSS